LREGDMNENEKITIKVVRNIRLADGEILENGAVKTVSAPSGLEMIHAGKAVLHVETEKKEPIGLKDLGNEKKGKK